MLSAVDASSALQIFVTTSPSLVMLEQDLPDLGGLAICRRIRGTDTALALRCRSSSWRSRRTWMQEQWRGSPTGWSSLAQAPTPERVSGPGCCAPAAAG